MKNILLNKTDEIFEALYGSKTLSKDNILYEGELYSNYYKHEVNCLIDDILHFRQILASMHLSINPEEYAKMIIFAESQHMHNQERVLNNLNFSRLVEISTEILSSEV